MLLIHLVCGCGCDEPVPIVQVPVVPIKRRDTSFHNLKVLLEKQLTSIVDFLLRMAAGEGGMSSLCSDRRDLSALHPIGRVQSRLG